MFGCDNVHSPRITAKRCFSKDTTRASLLTLAKSIYYNFYFFSYIRVTPSSPSLTRVLDQDVVLSGYHVPAKVSKKSQGWSLNPKACLLEALLCIRQRLHQSFLLESINLAAQVMARILGANHKRLLLNENSGYADKISLVALLENSLHFLPAPLRNIWENDIISM